MSARVLIAGYYGRRNAGDEAILAGMLAALRAGRADLEFCVLSGDPEATRRLHGVEAVRWDDLPGLVEAVRAAGLVIVGGGGLFHDYWGADARAALTRRQAGIAQYGAPLLLARLLGVPAMIYAAGVGPLRTPEGRALTRDAVAAADIVTVRDGGSRALLADLGCDAAAIEIVPDPAFDLPRAEDAAIAQALHDLPRPVLGVALRHWAFGVDPAAWQAETAAALDAHLEAHGGTALFVPLQDGEAEVEDDAAVARAVIGRMRRGGQAALAPAGLDPLQRFGLLERCDRALAMRMHGAVAALRGGVPLAALAYDPKVGALMAEAGLARAALSPEGWRRERIAAALAEASIGRAPAAAPSRAAEIALELLRRGPQHAAPQDAAVRALALEKVVEVLRLEGEIDGARGEAEALQEQLGGLRLVVEAVEAESRRLERERSALDEQVRTLRYAIEAERAAAAQRIEALGAQAQQAAGERDEALGQLAALRATLGVRLLARYWGWARRALPPGSRRRRAAAGLRRLLIGGQALAPPLGAAGLVGGGSAEPVYAEELRAFLAARGAQAPERAALILAPTQLLEDEGQRSTHLALELARRGVPVLFGYWRWDRAERRPQDRADEGIFQVPLDELAAAPGPALAAFPQARRLLLIEFPHPDFFGLAAAARGRGWLTLYDVIDDWAAFQRAGQAPWYRAEYEAQLLATADALAAVSPALVERVRRTAGREPALIPNGVRPEVARVDAPLALERGEVTLGYFGNLTPAWFDWDLIRKVAKARPSWRVHLIGFGGAPPRALPSNVHLHGKAPPARLAAYAENWDAGVIPFKSSALAAAADTTKLYEYLAMGLPVVVTGVIPPQGTEGLVHRAVGVEGFIGLVERAVRPGAHDAGRGRAFAASCVWSARLDQLLGLIERGDGRLALQAALSEAGG